MKRIKGSFGIKGLQTIRRKYNYFKVLITALSLVFISLWVSSAVAFETWSFDRISGNCANCHGHFRDNTYISLTSDDPVFWNNDLEREHLNMFPLLLCGDCHSDDQRFPVYLNPASDPAGDTVGLGCVGCHGRSEDVTPNDGAFGSSVPGWGDGLRAHHVSVGVTICTTCHTADSVQVGEDVAPEAFVVFGVDPCDENAGTIGTGILGSVGLDNDGDGLREVDDPDCSAVNVPPVSDPNGPYSGTIGSPITFDGSASNDPDGTIVSYDWDFGDGSTGTGMTPTYTYAASGSFTVTLTVTDDAGAIDTVTTSANVSLADVSAPPTNQFIGFPDSLFSSLTEADCRVCHFDSGSALGTADTHHSLFGETIPEGSVVPYPDVDETPGPDTTYGCLNCHESDPPDDFVVERDCTVCHTTSLHHKSTEAQNGNCVICHGDLVDNMDDGHYIPIYEPSLVTPARSLGEGQPFNSRSNGAGACDYCHDDDRLASPTILSNPDLHHGTDLVNTGDTEKCLWCHELSSTGDYKIRDCERCHGPDSLHNIQVDSTNADNIGTIVIGGEDAGYGHVGRDAGPGDSDCWGCHGFSSAPLPDPGDYPDDHPSYYEAPYDTEADCRVCHDFYVPDRHHVLYGNDFPSLTNAPYWTPGDVIYVCLSCHGPSLTLVRDCLVCHNNDDDSDGDGLTDGKERSIGTDPSDTDSDDDEIIDGLDTCPLDALNDADGDGVCGDVDICPGFDDTIDADGDSVPDGCDACPLDNPDDSDSDGVCDSADVCPGFDDTIDGDGDSVPDGCDICPGGDDNIDTDSDAIPDFCDICPLDNPDDSDSDGVCDSADVCPGFDDTIDGDGDSVPDGCDICPGGDDNIDTDSDAIPDFCDICPNDDLNDADGDGVCGDVDACPSEDATGFDIDSDGCLDDFGGLTDDINSLITSGVIDQNLADPLIKKVTNAEKSELKNNICAAVNQLEAFQNQIEDKRENPLSNEEADQLINYAENVIFQLLAKLPEGESCH